MKLPFTARLHLHAREVPERLRVGRSDLRQRATGRRAALRSAPSRQRRRSRAELELVGVALAGYHVARMREEASSEPLDDYARHRHAKVARCERLRATVQAALDLRQLAQRDGRADIVGRRPFGARPNAPRWLQVGAKLAVLIGTAHARAVPAAHPPRSLQRRRPCPASDPLPAPAPAPAPLLATPPPPVAAPPPSPCPVRPRHPTPAASTVSPRRLLEPLYSALGHPRSPPRCSRSGATKSCFSGRSAAAPIPRTLRI